VNEPDIQSEIHFVDDHAGWDIALKRVRPPKGVARAKYPAIIVPGYQMNSFIFGFHPNGLSLEAYLASRGIETWSVDLRAQGRARMRPNEHAKRDGFGLGELAVEDLGAAIEHVLDVSGARAVDLLGCSLGTAIAFAHVACAEASVAARVRALVAMGGVVTWVDPSFALRVATRSPRLASMLSLRNARQVAKIALPLAAKISPLLVSPYVSTRSTDTRRAAEMTQTVEDAVPSLNHEICEWIANRELVVRGVNVSHALGNLDHPFLCVVGNHDGIVPPRTARATFDAMGTKDKELVVVGDEETPMAHADLFLATRAPELVFEPIANFLLARA
jgi:pimeloyl-ACP methyl ester carboxylesterase